MPINDNTTRPPWAREQLAESHCIAILNVIDNELARLKYVREKVSASYMPRPFVLATDDRRPMFTMNDAMAHLLDARRGTDRKVIALLQAIAVEMENAHKDRLRIAKPALHVIKGGP